MRISMLVGIILSLCAVSGAAVAGQTPRVDSEMQRFPDTAPGRHLAVFLQTFNAGDKKAIARYVTDHYQSGIDVDSETLRWLRHRSVYGPLELHSIIVSNDSTLRVFTLGSITKGWVELTARISRDQPARLRSIAVGEGLRPESPGLSDKPASSSALVEQVRGYLDRLANEGFFSGRVLVAKNDTAIFEAAFGLADRSHEVPIRADTKFNIGSITKIFTALAVLQLAEHGKLSLDDSAAGYLPDYPGGLDERIRIRHLLTHTSGMGRGAFDSPIFPNDIREIRRWLPLTVSDPEFVPGENVRYSNGAWIVLGAIIEQVSGKSWFDYVRESIYAPAGMRNSDAYEVDIPVANIAVGYTHAKRLAGDELTFDPSTRRSAIFLNGLRGHAAGLTYSTSGDLLRFRNALTGGKLLGPGSTERFLTAQVEIPGEPDAGIRSSYGYGWEIDSIGKTTMIGKAGGSWGVSARFDMYPDAGYTVIVLSNYDSIATVVANHVRDLIVGD